MAVGDTAGHVLPAMAIVAAYREIGLDIEATFFTGRTGTASLLVAGSGEMLHLLPATPLMRVGLLGRAAGVARVFPTVVRARRLLQKHGVRLVIGTGGHVSGGVLLAARSLGLGTAILEPNAVPGLANRLLSPVAERVYVMFEETAARFVAGRTLVTGLPQLPSRGPLLRDRSAPTRDRAVRVFVTGGSRGDAFFAEHLPPLVALLQEQGIPVSVRHQVASSDFAALERAYEQRNVNACVVPFLDDVAQAYNWADLVIARSGAGTLADLALAGVPSLLVPLADAAADHQTTNAAAFAARGAAIWVPERGWSVGDVAARIIALVGTASNWACMSSAARAFARPYAAAMIVRDCEQLMRSRW
jgi:UDP-N-acetylglucosamine--N-acetylmuramyl-(pentapeptide) pyrophosphoryl-undecaprenol N-acetylglucosamine transferase